MPTIGASAIVTSADEVLLIKRRDCEAWALPGGNVDAGESVAQAAVREVREETGIEIELTRLVGIYSSPRWREGGNHSIVFAATPRTQGLTPQPEEVVEAGYYPPHNLPEPFVWWHRRWIVDALGGAIGTVCLQDRVWPWGTEVKRLDLHRLYEESGLSPQEFFLKYLTRTGPQKERIEVAREARNASAR
ncbi:MAG: NUDIX domain-containing protein [Gemmatimonadota bacterium]|nr:NUDIX domain-containing protein [Gemmatimonadota bacterium]